MAEFQIPKSLDAGKFCSGVDGADVDAALGVAVAKPSTEGPTPDNLYCLFSNKQGTVGVNIIWSRKPADPVAEIRKRQEADPSYKDAGCTFPDVGPLDASLAYQNSCTGVDKSGSVFPAQESLFYQVGKTILYCQVYGPAEQVLPVNAAEAEAFCQGVAASLM